MLSHPSDEEIEKFLATRLDPATQQRVVRHLLAGCGVCSRKLVENAPELLLERAGDRSRRLSRRSPRERALATSLEQEARWRTDERKLARSLELLSQSPSGYDALTFQQVRDLHGPPLIEALLQRAWKLRYQDPKAVRWLTYNAVKAAESLSPEEHRPSFVLDLQARAWGELANAYRMNTQLAEAEGALARARTLLRQGGTDPRCLARLAELEGSLRNTQGRWMEAHELFDRTYRLYLAVGERHLAGQALIAKGNTGADEGGSLESVRLVQKGLSLIDRDRDPNVVFAGTQTLIAVLGSYGDFRTAGELILKSGLRQMLSANEFGLLKLRWAEAMVLKGFGRLSKAERILLTVQEGFAGLERTIEPALVGLHLLPVWHQQGKSREVKAAARRLYGTFRDLRLHHEAAKALPYLQ